MDFPEVGRWPLHVQVHNFPVKYGLEENKSSVIFPEPKLYTVWISLLCRFLTTLASATSDWRGLGSGAGWVPRSQHWRTLTSPDYRSFDPRCSEARCRRRSTSRRTSSRPDVFHGSWQHSQSRLWVRQLLLRRNFKFKDSHSHSLFFQFLLKLNILLIEKLFDRLESFSNQRKYLKRNMFIIFTLRVEMYVILCLLLKRKRLKYHSGLNDIGN